MKTTSRLVLPGAFFLAVLLPFTNLSAAPPKATPRSSVKAGSTGATETLEAELTVQPPELSPASTIEVVFPTPMIPKERIGTKEAVSPLEVTPPLNGVFEWVSTRSGQFRLAQAPRFNASYDFKLRSGLQDVAGKPLSTGTLATVESAKFRTIDQHPKWFDNDEAQRRPVFLFEFNDNLTPADAAKSIRFISEQPPLTVPAKVRHATGKDFKRRSAEPQPTWAEEIAKVKPVIADDASRLSALIVEPESPLPVATQWKLQLAETLTNASGHDQVAQGDELKLGNVNPFAVAHITAHTPLDESYFLDVTFNKDLIPFRDTEWKKEELAALAEKLATAVHFQPEVKDLTAEVTGRTLRFEGAFALNQPYRVTVEPAITSGDGLPLEAVLQAESSFVPNPPYIAAPAFLRAQLAKGAGDFEFVAANVREVRVRVKRLSGPELLQAADKYEGYRSAYYREEKERAKFKPEPIDSYNGTLIYERTVAVSKPLDQSDVVKLNWREILAGAPAAPLFLELEGRAAPGVNHQGIITQTLVQFTDLGLMQKSNGKDTLVFVTSLQTGKPVAGARLTLVDEEQKLIGYGDTDANGTAAIKGATPAFVLAEKDGDCSVIQCRDSHIGGVIPYTIPTAWEDVWKPARRTFLFSDRPLYRPGDTAHFKAHTRLLVGDDLQLASTALTGRMKLRDPRYRIIMDKAVTFTTNGAWAEDLQLPEGPLGWYELSLELEPKEEGNNDERNRGSYTFRIDDYKPNTFEVKLDGTKVQLMPDRMKLQLSANYYMGKALSRAKVSWHANSSREFIPPEAFEEYHFGEAPLWSHYGKDRDADGSYDDHDEANAGEWWVSGDMVVEEEGTATLEMPLPPPDRASLPQQVHVSAEVTDINQQTVSAGTEFEVPGAQFLLGLKGPQFFGSAGQEMSLEIVAIDSKGQPAADNLRIDTKIERQEYHTIKLATAGGGSTTKDQVILREEFKQPVDLKAGSAKTPPTALITFKPSRSGSYFLTAEATDAAGKKVLSRLPIFVIGGGEFPWAMEDGARINLQPEKETLKPGEEAVIVVKTPIAGTALVSVERNRVHRHFVTQVSPDNPIVRVPVQDAEAPNVFVSVVVVRGSDASPKQHKMPEYKVGYCQLEVESKAKELTIAIKPDRDEVKPAEPVNVTATVTDFKGQPVAGSDVTLYAVDEGVLSLMKHETPDPSSFFHALFPLAIDNFTSFDDILPEEAAARERGNKGFVIGGGGEEVDPAAMKVRKNFVATPLWVATAMTDTAGQIKASFTAPDNLTRYRLMAIAAHGVDRFGSGESALTINKPLMVDPVVPRFARLGDEVMLKAVVHNTTQQEGEVEVSLQLDATADFIREPRFFVPANLKMQPETDTKLQKHVVTIKAGETTSAAFPIRFDKLGTAKWRWTARTTKWTAGAPALEDATESSFEVTHPVPELREVRYARLSGAEPADNLVSQMNPALLEGQGTLQVSVSTSRLFEVRDALSYVLTYPYGCAEQVSSATTPWLALSGYQPLFPDLLATEKNKAAVQAGVNKLMQMTTDEGGLSYWPGGQEASLWGSAYGGLMLLRARDAGATVPAETIDKLLAFLSKSLRGLEDEQDFHQITDCALALYTLAKGKKAEPAYQTLLHSRRDRLPEAARLYTALAMCLSDTPEQQIKDMLGWTPPEPERKTAAKKSKSTKKPLFQRQPAPVWSHWAGNGSNKAIRLIAYTHLGLTEEAESLAVSLLQGRTGRGEWGNTYTNAWVLTALAAYERSLKKAGGPLTASVLWGDQNIPLQITTPIGTAQASIDLNDKLAAAPLQLQLPADRQAFGRIQARAFAPNRDFAGENKGYAISRNYEKVLADGAVAEAKDLRVGDMVVVTLGIEIGGGDRYLAINDPLPSVLEAINPEFETQNARSEEHLPEGIEPWFCDHREIRSDRALFFTDFAPSKGKFQLRYLTRVIAEGDTIAPPARIEAMYEPDKYGLSPSQRLQTLPSASGQVAGK